MYPYKIGKLSPIKKQIAFTKTLYNTSAVPVLHAHTGYEVLFIKSAQFTAISGTSFYTGDAPCLVFFGKGMYHGTARYYCETVPYIAYPTNFDSSVLEMVEGLCPGSREMFSDSFRVIRLDESACEEISDLLERASSANGDAQMNLGYLLIYISIIRRLIKENGTAPFHRYGDAYILDAIRLIVNEIGNGNQIKVSELPKKFCVCSSKFLKDFKEVTGVSAKEYIAICALDRAKRLLAKGHDIGETAQECGFSSTSYFIQFFNHHEGITPGMYRKQCFEENRKEDTDK